MAYRHKRGLGTTSLAQAIFRQEGVLDANGNWVTSSLGYRLNNPGNLNYAGQPGATPTTSGNGQEAQFDSLADGIAATDAQLDLDASRGLTLAQRLADLGDGESGGIRRKRLQLAGGGPEYAPFPACRVGFRRFGPCHAGFDCSNAGYRICERFRGLG